MKKLKNSKGFTLMEMLIVVAIIAILIAIAIPTFTNQLEKAREAADLANIRSAYAEVMAASLTNDDTNNDTHVNRSGNAGSYTWSKDVDATKLKTTWVSTSDGAQPKIGEVTLPQTALKKGETWTVSYTEGEDSAKIAKKAG